MIKIVDYGLGNVRAFLNVFKRLSIPAESAQSAEDLEDASKLILPGVGSFDHAMELLEKSGMQERLHEMVIVKKTPVLGVCVGMQILAASSEEGKLAGLHWINGAVKKLPNRKSNSTLRLPHMGWNDVVVKGASKLFYGLENDARFYFLHSYYFECESEHSVLATSEYGIEFACAVNSDNVYGVQFHPEKSHLYGTRLLKNFSEM